MTETTRELGVTKFKELCTIFRIVYLKESSNTLLQGSRVWLPDREEVWKDGVVVAYSPKDNILVSDSSGKVC